MNWESWSAFAAMGGYAPYVWGSYAVTFALMAVEVVLLALRKHNILDHLGRGRAVEVRAAAAIEKAHPKGAAGRAVNAPDTGAR